MVYLWHISPRSLAYFGHITCISYLTHISGQIPCIFRLYLKHISYIYQVGLFLSNLDLIWARSNISLSKPEANYRHIPGTSQTCPFQKYIVSIRGKMNRNNSANFEYPFETGISGKKRIIRIKMSHIRLYLIIRLIFGFRFLLKRIVILKNPYSFNTLTDSSFEKSGSV